MAEKNSNKKKKVRPKHTEKKPIGEVGKKKREELGKILERAEKHLEKIEKEEVEITGVGRIKDEIGKIKREVIGLPGIKSEKERRTIYGLIAIIIFLGILAFPMPGLSVLGQRTIAIFALVIFLWITSVLPLPATALIPGILLYFMGVRPTPSEAFKTYAHPAVFFIIGSLLIAQGLIQSGLGKRFALFFLSKCKNNPNILLFILIAISAAMAAVLSDLLVVALLLPVVITMVVSAKIYDNFRISLVLAVAFGAGIAGLATPSGGARNVVTLGLLEDIAAQQLSYAEWAIAAIPITLLLIPVTWIILRMLYPPKKDLDLSKAVSEIKKTLKPMSKKEWKVLAVFLLIIGLFVTTSNLIGLGTIALIGAILMFLVGAVDWEEAEKGVAWGVMFIYGAALTMGIALKDTGAAEWLARGALNILPHSSPLILIAGIILLTALITAVVSDGAAASILAPITINIALLAGIEPRLMALATAIPCAFAFITIFGTPPNTVAYSSGFFDAKQLFKAGIFLELAAIGVILLIVKYYWAWLGLW